MAEPARDATSSEEVDEADELETIALDSEASAADMLDQARTVWETEGTEAVHIPDDVPEADALEQARVVSLDEDLERHDEA